MLIDDPPRGEHDNERSCNRSPKAGDQERTVYNRQQAGHQLAGPAPLHSIEDEKATGGNSQQQQPNPGPAPGKT